VFPFLINAQTIANKVWEANGGTPADDLIYQQSTLDNMNNLIIVGNTYTTGQEENVWIAKYDPEGTLLWQYEYNYASNGRDYATNVITDANGNIFVTGSIFDNLSNTFDFLTLKISATGTLQWTATHDANGFDDVAADIALDANGNIYVTGGSQVSTTDWNYTTIKYTANGTLVWTQQYDYANLRDVAVNIVVSNNAVIVTGASANTTPIEAASNDNLKVYPIPTSDEVTIEFTLAKNTNISLDVFDLNGRLIKTVLTGT
jgi:hypothetical protein